MRLFAAAMLLLPLAVIAGYPLGAEVEDFTLLTPQGEPLSLSDFHGDVILLNFFATW